LRSNRSGGVSSPSSKPSSVQAFAVSTGPARSRPSSASRRRLRGCSLKRSRKRSIQSYSKSGCAMRSSQSESSPTVAWTASFVVERDRDHVGIELGHDLLVEAPHAQRGPAADAGVHDLDRRLALPPVERLAQQRRVVGGSRLVEAVAPGRRGPQAGDAQRAGRLVQRELPAAEGVIDEVAVQAPQPGELRVHQARCDARQIEAVGGQADDARRRRRAPGDREHAAHERRRAGRGQQHAEPAPAVPQRGERQHRDAARDAEQPVAQRQRLPARDEQREGRRRERPAGERRGARPRGAAQQRRTGERQEQAEPEPARAVRQAVGPGRAHGRLAHGLDAQRRQTHRAVGGQRDHAAARVAALVGLRDRPAVDARLPPRAVGDELEPQRPRRGQRPAALADRRELDLALLDEAAAHALVRAEEQGQAARRRAARLRAAAQLEPGLRLQLDLRAEREGPEAAGHDERIRGIERHRAACSHASVAGLTSAAGASAAGAA
jgi:hypothetical protein